ncbi:ubiquinol-cytochrome C chaperone family protein [Bradyrhizobium sp.]|jgi:cytochrome b pre-mRNA-processing protein 3|uniref:ubiquinol-cytochrome C chaperone family protein n=1 Tax=Bradyrhizobium sp. TaxID=376 RepID=UPI002D0536EB|nr:ubiquinol-cytochrome C chaperone family protein [Bradyrhizobium sp.]HWX57404.1 ubiquinol-cytochrome C chaperone family protein [Bradyrhizobium sp.]
MRWPFNRFRRPRLSPSDTIEAIYGMIVTQAREPLFYRHLGVPDTVDGRFDLLLLHLWIVLRRLRASTDGAEPARALSQGLFDRFCEDMDDNLREMGVGDLAVPRRMEAFGKAFYGRSKAYDLALGQRAEKAAEPGVNALAQAIGKNILNGGGGNHASELAAYTMAAMTSLAACDDAAVQRGIWTFPSPESQRQRA